jgi:hypothetical protein
MFFIVSMVVFNDSQQYSIENSSGSDLMTSIALSLVIMELTFSQSNEKNSI